MARIDRGSPDAWNSGRSGQWSDSDRLLEAARRHEHGQEVRPRQILQGRSDVPIRTSSHYSVGRQLRLSGPSRERAAAAGSSTQVLQSTADPAVSRTPTVAGHPIREVGSDEAVLRAVSAWLGERGISARSSRWLSLTRSEAVQRMVLASRRFLLCPCPAFSVRQRSSDAVTRGLQPVAPSWISSIPLTSRGVPPPSSLLEGSGVQTRPSTLRASSGGTRMLTTLGVPPPSCLIASPSLGNSVSSLSVVPKPAGIVEGVETFLKAAIMVDQQLTTAFPTGLRHSLDDSDHDAMSDLSEK